MEADDFLGACYRKAMTPQKLWTLLYPHLYLGSCAVSNRGGPFAAIVAVVDDKERGLVGPGKKAESSSPQ